MIVQGIDAIEDLAVWKPPLLETGCHEKGSSRTCTIEFEILCNRIRLEVCPGIYWTSLVTRLRERTGLQMARSERSEAWIRDLYK